jgi:murein DD-endopeptidase MepM/ murein hydrolase activator NlpD
MFEKFKEKCKALSKNRAAVVTFVIILLTLTVVLSVSIATNRAKKKYGDESGNAKIEQTEAMNKEKETELSGGSVDLPTHNGESEAPVGAEPEIFELSLPAEGVLAKDHDATIQVWSETMSDYRVHLGVDIATEEGAPVFAAADGVIEKVWDDALMGRCVAISHGDEIYTFYKNLDPELSAGIEADAEVKCGQQIGKVGESAIAELADEPHLHVEMTIDGLSVDPIDYFNKEAKAALENDTAYESAAVTEENIEK